MSNGYQSRQYAAAMSEFGQPHYLAESDGWVLARPIAETLACDAMGLYPIFTCANWAGLKQDVERMSNHFVSLMMVTDPFMDINSAELATIFPDRCFPFKAHYITDLRQSPEQFVAAHHRRNARKGLRNLQIDISTNPVVWLDDWLQLYEQLIERHAITDMRAFSSASFAVQMRVPGMTAMRACADGETVGMVLWLQHNNVAYYHLGAYNSLGYQLRASFAIFWSALGYFADRQVRWLSLGAAAGLKPDEADGLDRFKRGWATETRDAYLCGRVLNRPKYNELTCNVSPQANYFPAYRYGEF